MKSRRILILTGIFPPDIGGPARFLEALAQEFLKAGFPVSILTYGKKDKSRAYPVFRICKKYPYILRSFLFFTLAFFLALKHDIIYNQDLYGAGQTSYWFKKILGKKLVTRFVGDSAWEKAYSRGLVQDNVLDFQKNKYGPVVEKLKKRRDKILTASDRVVVASNFLKKVALAMGLPGQKIRVIYNSVDFVKTKDLASKNELRRQFNLKGKILLTSARLVPWKGVKMLVEIMPELIEKQKEIKLLVLGDGPEMPGLKSLVSRLGLFNRVFLIGRVSREDAVKYFKSADLFVLNTYYEGMSHTLLEAMKVKTPIITTWAGGNPETIRDKETGMLVEYNNKSQWRKAISFMLNNPEKSREYAQKAENDLKRFSWQNLVKETIGLFNQLS